MASPRSLDPSESPKAFYGAELRRLREAKGLSQDALGELVFCSGAYIGQMEAATRQPQKDLSERLDAALDTDGYFARLYPMVTRSRFADYFAGIPELQTMAETLSSFEPDLVPGLLQTADYAREIFRSWNPLRAASDIEELVRLRTARARILDGPTRPQFWAILGESILRRPVGGPAVMHGQLSHIAHLVHSRRVIVQVLPFSAGAHALLEGSLILLTFVDAPPVAYSEGPFWGQLLDDPAFVAKCSWSYDLVRAAALSPEASLALIESAAEDFAHEQD
ncbi:helix-turn-helix transcriptional regulator [Kitasatospora sp. GP82]|uniref:helix-turn-helix domain-containing protein n=1 Tax=Kitasatospora sp. GP82 TaxID=3035089 RepID=UPI00247621A0|nr:helix-turn-helix transcriptional regulator [Kitasatospora sp. GP82]MDH6123611.1 transcriptional regulator with XRE-family HTH domain [Kitasatospora sp. GP82]